MPSLSKTDLCIYLTTAIGLAERKKESSKWKPVTAVSCGISQPPFFHQDSSSHIFIKGMNELQTCCTTYLFSKSQFMIFSHFRLSSQESGGKWRAGSWLNPLFFPALSHLTWKELYAHTHHTLVYIFQTLFRSLPQQLLLGHFSPKLTYTSVMGYPEGTHTQGRRSHRMVVKAFLDACYLDLDPGKEGLCFYVGKFMDWLPWAHGLTPLPHEEDSAGEGPGWYLLNVESRSGVCLTGSKHSNVDPSCGKN